MTSALTSGVGVWLNTPLPPLEASETSGMKGAISKIDSCFNSHRTMRRYATKAYAR